MPTFPVDALMLDSAFQSIGALEKYPLNPFIEEKAGAVDPFVDHARREIVWKTSKGWNGRWDCSHRKVLNNNARRGQIGVRFAERGDDTLTAPFRRTEVYKEDLVVVMMNDRAEFRAQPHDIRGSELAFKNRVLEVISVAAHCLKHLSQPLVVGNVIADQKGAAHRLSSC